MVELGNPFAILIELLGVISMACIVVLLLVGRRELEFEPRQEAGK